ncbi:phage tail tape measure protein [Ureibacillus chungkukjangi]|uniref:phage tail tape measure protein n=1 Tax=Ureibacillus chungkukjangi TaxID=1202712 RepID=UPI00203C84D1|nr:phage tail tape measure protein [Ureibacillus chungkukjangi]MCM3387347.1 phage tail tape measure protein [Ureibacillus chungkukjangi]
MAASTAFFGVIRTAREFGSILIDIDSKLVSIAKVMSEDMNMEDVFNRATQSAQNFGKSITEALDAYIEFARQGYKGDELGVLADVGMISANVGEISAQKASEYITASLAQWSKEASESMSIINGWNNIANNYATSVEKLAQGQSRAGATAKAFGMTFDELNSVIGVVTASTKQSGTEVGNFIKSTLPRIVGAGKGVLEDLGIDVVNEQGKMRNVIDIYTEVAEKMKSLTDTEKASVVFGLGGTYHRTRMQVLLDDLGSVDSMYRSIYETSVNSDGSAMRENEKYMKSLEARINLAKVEVEKLAIQFGETFMQESIISGLKVFSSFLESVTKLTSEIGALPIVLGTTSVSVALLSTRFRTLVGAIGTKIGATVKDKVTTEQTVITYGKYTMATNTSAVATRKLSMSSTVAQASMMKQKLAMDAAAASATKQAVASKALSTTLRTLGVATGAGIGFFAIGALLEGILKVTEKNRELKESAETANKELVNSYKNNQDSIDQLIIRYQKLEKVVAVDKSNIDTMNEYYDVQNQLGELLPSLVTGTDSHNRKLVESSTIIQTKIDMLKQQMELEKQIAEWQAKQDRDNRIEGNIELGEDNLKAYGKALKSLSNSVGWINSKNQGLFNSFIEDAPEFKNLNDVTTFLAKISELRSDAEKSGDNKAIEYFDELSEKIITAQGEINGFSLAYKQSMSALKVDYVSKLNDTLTTNAKLTETMSEKSINSISSLANELLSLSDVGDVENLNNALSTLFINMNADSEINNLASGFEKLNNATAENFTEISKTVEASMGDFKKSLINSGLSDTQIQVVMDGLREKLSLTVSEFSKLEDEMKQSGSSFAEAQAAAKEFGEGAEESNDAIQEQIDKLKELSSAQEQIVGVSESQVSAVKDYIFIIETLGNVSERTEQQESTLANTIALLSGLYPQLTSSLAVAGKQREQAIKIIDSENKANQALLKAYALAADGKLTAEAKATVGKLEETNKRIGIINDEILALDKLQQKYIEYADMINNSAKTSAGEYASDANLLLAEKLSKRIYNRVAPKLAQLATLSGTQSSYASSLQSTVDAIEEAEKANNKSNKSTKDSIYFTDKYKKALEALNLEIEKQQALREGEVDSSEKYRKSLEAQIKLEQQKLKLQQDQAKALDVQIKSGKIQQTGSVSVSSSATTTKSSYASGGSSEATIWNFFKSKGFSDSIVAGIMGNLKMESNFNSSAKNPTSGAFGIAQWLGGRKSGLSSYANSLGTSMSDLSTQLNWLWKELNGSEKKTLNWINSNPNASASQMAAMFDKLFERSEGTHIPQRQNYANQILSKYSGTGVSSVSIDSTGQAIDTTQQAIDDAQSSLLSLKSDILSQQNLIKELEQQIIESNLAYFTARRENFNREIDYETAKMQELDTNSSRYAKTLELMKTHMTQKQKVNKDELKYIQQQINSGKLSNEMLEQMKIRYKELTTEVKSLQVELRQMDYDIIINIKVQGDEKIDDIEYQISRLQAIRNRFEEGSGDYNASIKEEIKHQAELTKAYKSQREEIQKQLKTRILNAAQLKEMNELLEELSLSYQNSASAEKALAKELEESNKSVAHSIADGLWDAYQGYLKERQEEHKKAIEDESKREEDAHKKRKKQLEDEMNLYRKSVQEKLDLIDKQEADRDYNMEMSDLQKERNELERLINLYSMDTSNEGKAKVKSLQSELDAVNKEISEKQHDRNVQLQKDTLSEMLELKEEENKELQDLEDERYDNVVKTIDREKEYWDKHYNDLINDERKHAQLREDVMNGNFAKIEAEFGQHVKDMEATLPSLRDTLDGTMQAVGTSIRQNVIDSLKEAITLMNEFKGNKEVTGGYNGGNSSSSPTLSSADMKVIMGKYMTTNLMYQETNEGRRKIIEESAWNLANQGRSEGSSISKTATFGSIISGLSGTDLQALASFMQSQKSIFKSDYLQDYIQDYINQLMSSAASLSTGGMIPNSSGGVDGIGGRFAIVHPKEVINSPIDTERLLQTSSIMERVANLIKPISSSILKGINNVTSQPIIVQFGDVVGATPQQAENFATKIVSGVKRKGGKI